MEDDDIVIIAAPVLDHDFALFIFDAFQPPPGAWSLTSTTKTAWFPFCPLLPRCPGADVPMTPAEM